MPMAKVRTGFCSNLVATEHTREESSPPESRKPTGASESSLFSIACISRLRMCFEAVSASSWHTAEGSSASA